MSRNLTTPSIARLAAGFAMIVLVLISALHVYWALGGDWALSTATAGTTKTNSSGLQIFAGVIAVLALLAAIEILAIRASAAGRLHRISSTKVVWAMVVILALGGIGRSVSAPAIGITAIILAALFASVAFASKPHTPSGSA